MTTSQPRLAARQFVQRALGLTAPLPDVAAALDHLGYVQIDPINVCGRMHELILRNRVLDYAEGDLFARLHAPSQRAGFEHYLWPKGILVAFPWNAWPFVQTSMVEARTRQSNWSGALDADQAELATTILARLAAGEGPLSSDDILDTRGSFNGWGSNLRLAKVTLDKLCFHGRVLIAERRNYRRYYDLPENIVPPEVLAQPMADDVTTQRWRVATKLRQHRLVRLNRAELAVGADLAQAVEVEGCGTLYYLPADAPLWEAAATADARPQLLAPLDPLIYDRVLTSRLWDFDYTWEVYTPEPKRTRGYYALPVLNDEKLVGHVDLKADRKARRLNIISRKVTRSTRTAPAVAELARFLQLRSK